MQESKIGITKTLTTSELQKELENQLQTVLHKKSSLDLIIKTTELCLKDKQFVGVELALREVFESARDLEIAANDLKHLNRIYIQQVVFGEDTHEEQLPQDDNASPVSNGEPNEENHLAES